MLHTISNDFLDLSVETRGAELRSLRDAARGTEYLWQGSPESWTGRAPLLFPVIGRLKKGSYLLGGRSYPMPIHGFARDSEFRATRGEDGSLSLFLGDSARTRAFWPFEFELEVRYTLLGPTLRKDHILRNTGRTELLYELGGHEGWNAPLLPGGTMRDCQLRFEGLDSLRSRTVDGEVMITRDTRTLALDGGRLDLDMALFDNDALILEDTGDKKVTLGLGQGGGWLRLSFSDFRYLALWSPAGRRETRFICIEPWSSLPDCSYLGDELEEKEGVRRLAAGATESLGYTMEFGGLPA